MWQLGEDPCVSLKVASLLEELRRHIERHVHFFEGIELLWPVDLYYCHILVWEGDVEELVVVLARHV